MELDLLTPLGALVALAALLPAAAVLAVAARGRRVAAALGLAPAPWRAQLRPLVLATLVCALLALAAAQPALTTRAERAARTESQVFFVLDVSRSMRAAAAPGARARLARARTAASRLRAAVPDVPAGLAGLTDRALPYLFPTLDRATFAETLRVAVVPESPPPQQVARVATSLDALDALARDGFFPPAARRRTCVVLTDGETAPFASGDVARALRGRRGCRLVLVHVWSPDERVYDGEGRAEPQYRPDPAARATLERLAEVTGGAAFAEADVDGATAALRAAASVGPEARRGTSEDVRELAPFLAGAALLLLAALVITRRATATLRPATRVSYGPFVQR